jgi:hypothetical protein
MPQSNASTSSWAVSTTTSSATPNAASAPLSSLSRPPRGERSLSAHGYVSSACGSRCARPSSGTVAYCLYLKLVHFVAMVAPVGRTRGGRPAPIPSEARGGFSPAPVLCAAARRDRATVRTGITEERQANSRRCIRRAAAGETGEEDQERCAGGSRGDPLRVGKPIASADVGGDVCGQGLSGCTSRRKPEGRRRRHQLEAGRRAASAAMCRRNGR